MKTKKYNKEKRDGLRVSYLLKKKGYTLVDVGRDVGVSRQAVHKVVHGQSNSEEILNHIASLGVPLRSLGAEKR